MTRPPTYSTKLSTDAMNVSRSFLPQTDPSRNGTKCFPMLLVSSRCLTGCFTTLMSRSLRAIAIEFVKVNRKLLLGGGRNDFCRFAVGSGLQSNYLRNFGAGLLWRPARHTLEHEPSRPASS